MHSEKEFYTIKEFADKIRVHHNTVRKALKSGKIQGFRISDGKRAAYRISCDEVQRLCELDIAKLIAGIVEKKIEEMKNDLDAKTC